MLLIITEMVLEIMLQQSDISYVIVQHSEKCFFL